MCGLTGYWALNGSSAELKPRLSKAIQSIRHRGPDDSGLWFGQNVGFAHARLSILDLSSHGHQPMLSEDHNLIVVFNGEIYNFKEIRQVLEASGYSFKGDSDTEVVVNAFSYWGKDCVNHFIGMFAFAIWDIAAKKMFLCRDRVGVKPLYYSWLDGDFYFASELKAIKACNPKIGDIDKQALGEYFQYGYIAAPRSIYQHTFKVPPGCWLELQEGGRPVIEKYWSVDDAVAKGEFKLGEDDLEDELHGLLKSAFTYRMISDVPVGVFLSGGIDSSLLASIIQKNSSEDIHTYTIGFENTRFDESLWAKKISKHIGSKHTEFLLNVEDSKNVVPKLAEIYDEPFGDSSAIPTYMVSKLSRRDVKVALSADGGDELFGGYSSYRKLPKRLNSLLKYPYPVRSVMNGVLGAVPTAWVGSVFSLAQTTFSLDDDWSEKGLDRYEKIKYVLPHVYESDLFDMANSYWLPSSISRLIGGYQNPRITLDGYEGSFKEKMMLWDYKNYLPDDILVKMDRATMSNGLEGREPLLDHRLVEFAYRLPIKYKMGSLGSKHILRKILYKYVPQEMIDRPKQGFSIPLDAWLRGDLSYLIDEYLNPHIVSKCALLNVKEVSLLTERFRKKQGVSASRIWFLLMFMMWYESSLT